MAVGGRGPERDLAERLHEWATQEMHFLPQGPYQGKPPPTAAQLRRICRGSQQAALWNYVIQHVYSVQTIKKMRGNLQLKGRPHRHGYKVKYKTGDPYDDQQDKLLQQRAQLQEETTLVQSEIRQLEQEVERMGRDIQASEVEYQKEVEGVRDMGRRACLLRLYSQSCSHFSNTLDAFSDKIQARADSFHRGKTGVDTALHSRHEKGREEKGGEEEEEEERKKRRTRLETTTTRDVRTTCEFISKFLLQKLEGSFSEDVASARLNKEQLWKHVETTLSDHSIELVVNALVQMSQQEARQLKERTQKVDVQKDAEKLKFKFEKGGMLTDTSVQPSVLQSVHQLLEESQMRHVLRFVETQKHRNAARPQAQQLEDTRGKIEAHLSHLFPHPSPTSDLARELVQIKLDLVGDRTALPVFREQGRQLKEVVAKEQANRNLLQTLHDKIQLFQTLANTKQAAIQTLAREIMGSKSRLTAQHVEVMDYISRTIPDHPMEAQTMMTGLREMVVEEVGSLSSLSLPYLLYLPLDRETRRGLLDLSINCTTHPSAIAVRQALHSVLSHLEFPPYKAPECVLEHCLWVKRQEEGDRQKIQVEGRLTSSAHLSSGVSSHLDNLPELCEKVKMKDQGEVDTLLPDLQKALSRAAKASTHCIKVKDAVQAWWEQPAQFLTHSLESQGLTFQQWCNKWRIIVTKIRQIYE